MRNTSDVRLSLMMFFYYFSMGASAPVMTLYFKDVLGFSGVLTGQILAMSALSVLIAPLLTAFVADKFLSSEKLFSLFQLTSGFLLIIVAQLSSFWPIIIFYTLYLIIYNPCGTLINAITFHHTTDGENQFGPIRMWGTIGWVISGLFFGFIMIGIFKLPVSSALYFSSFSSLALGIFSFFTPEPRINTRKRSSIFPSESILLFKKKSILLLVFSGFIAQAVDRYYFFGAASFFQDCGFANKLIVPFMALGQISEIITLAMGGKLIKKLGYRNLLFLGMLMELLRFLFFIPGKTNFLFLLLALVCQGMAFTFFFSTAFIYLDSQSSPKARSGVHLLFNLLTAGPGQYIGSALGGYFLDLFSKQFSFFWIPPALFSALALLPTLMIKNKNNKMEIKPIYPLA